MILPPSLREIRVCAFYDCHKLKEIAVPNECIKISANAFFFCAELTVYYPEKSNYYIIEAARVSCSKEKCRKLYPKRKFTKKEEKEAFVNVTLTLTLSLHTMSATNTSTLRTFTIVTKR